MVCRQEYWSHQQRQEAGKGAGPELSDASLLTLILDFRPRESYINFCALPVLNFAAAPIVMVSLNCQCDTV